jgi:hypothetical protein
MSTVQKQRETEEQERQRNRENRDRIARKFGHQTSGTTGTVFPMPTDKQMDRYRKAKDNMGNRQYKGTECS